MLIHAFTSTSISLLLSLEVARTSFIGMHSRGKSIAEGMGIPHTETFM